MVKTPPHPISHNTVCPRCGATASVSSGDLESICCSSCEWEQISTVYPKEALQAIDRSGKEVNVYLKWPDGGATLRDIVTARQAFSSLQDVPTAELLLQAKQCDKYHMGVFSLALAINIQKKGNARGLSILFTDILQS